MQSPYIWDVIEYEKFPSMSKGGKRFVASPRWIAEKKNPKFMCHPCISMVTETLCKGLVFKPLLISKGSFIFTVFVFIVASRS